MSKMKTPQKKLPFSLEKMIKGMPENAYSFSKEGRLLVWNKNVEILSGYSNDELQNRFVSELIHKPDKERVLEKFLEILANNDEKERIIEYSIKTKSGEIIPVIAMRSLIVVDGEEYIIGILIDIRKIRNNKEKLAAQIAEIGHLKNQLLEHYSKIEKMNQTEIELKDKLFINAKDFSNKLIDSLPGIFFVCEKTKNGSFLIRWNNNLVTRIGYLDEELSNMQFHQFFSENEYKKTKESIQQVIMNGSIKYTTSIMTKNKKYIPFVFEIYKFEEKDKLYLMCLGTDISYQIDLEQKHKRQEKEKQQTEEALDANKRELIATALQISRTNKTVESVKKNIDKLIEKHEGSDFCHDLNWIKKDLYSENSYQNNWEVFKLRFTNVHKQFFDNLKKDHPTLTKAEVKFCSYLKIHLSSSQISSVLNVTNEGIKKTRYRIRKKLSLSSKDSLEDYIEKY